MNPPSPQQSHVISQQVFGSSKKLQFIGISPMDSLLTAINHQTQQTKSATPPKTMSIESLLDSNGDTSNNKRRYPSDTINNQGSVKMARKKPNSGTTGIMPNSSTTINNEPTITQPTPISRNSQMTTLTCYHASVAQKSYGSEKRFLCPPPVVRIHSPDGSSTFPSLTPCHLTMSVINENGDRPLEQQAVLDDDQCTFKYLHVTGTAKAKQFSLSVSISANSPSSSSSSSSLPPSSQKNNIPYATFLSNPISIISKPSKKTAKTRNVSTCILANRPISLFNRINSQTVRTKYMTSENNTLCAKNGTWSPFEIIILNQPQHYQSIQRPSSSQNNSNNSNNSNNNNNGNNSGSVIPLIYGSELILRDTQTGVRSQPVVIRKVDKGRIVPGAYGPVSQMQKIALQLVTRSQSNSRRTRSMYLSAMGVNEANGASSNSVAPAHSPHTTLLDYSGSYMVSEGLDAYEKVDDYLCWTIVGISTFEYSFYDNHVQTPVATSPRTTSPASTLPLPQPSSSSSSSLSPSLSTSISNGHRYISHPPPELNTPVSPLSSPSPSSSLSSLSSLPSSLSSSSSVSITNSRPTQSSSSSSSPSTSTSSTSSTSSSLTLPFTSTANKLKSRCLTPFPTLTSIYYQASTHTLDIVGQHLMQAVPSPKLLEFWLGSHHGPLHTNLQPQPKQPHQTHLIIDIPPTQDLIVSNHDRLVISPGGNRTLELPLFLVREDGVVYHTGKALTWEMLVNSDAGRWAIIDVRQ